MSTELTAPGSSSILNKKIRPSDLILTVLILSLIHISEPTRRS